MPDPRKDASGQPIVTRFAPSPTGYLHLGHAYAALVAWHEARAAGGRFLLRIEDIDRGRCRSEFADAILEDLAWLGIDWDGPVWRQSDHLDDHARALDGLARQGVLYPCFCTRREIRDELARAGAAPHGPAGPAYPGTCRRLDPEVRRRRMEAGESYALRLDVARALASLEPEADGPLAWRDREAGRVACDPDRLGDVVLARKDVPTSYHLAVTVDDAAQGVTLITRGADLFEATHVHRLLQALLGLPAPGYYHHRLIAGADGRRFAKRDRSATLRHCRRAGASPAEVRRMIGFE